MLLEFYMLKREASSKFAMGNIFSIVTHDKDPEGAAKAWERDGVCAIGWSRYGNLKKSRNIKGRAATARDLFIGMRKGDVVLAYSTGNTIAYVGYVRGEYKYNNSNEVGVSTKFAYANQRKVEWWRRPRYFDRRDLPQWISSQLGKRKTITEIDLRGYGFEAALKIIRTCARVGSALSDFEDLAKAGIRKYADQEVEQLESGLRIISIERSISEKDRPDFIATDKNGRTVLIECKGTAREADCDQLLRYFNDFRSRNNPKPRLMLIAFTFDQSCRKTAKANHIETVECDLTFTKSSSVS
jgi:hypothetical protein